jgi:hypothetical protein
MASETEADRFAGFTAVAKAVTWVGASAGALTLCCTVFGFLVKRTTLDQLGISRAVFEPASTEYVVVGAEFLASVVVFALFGVIEFFVACWWVVAALALLVLVLLAARHRRWRNELRLLGVALLYAVWMAAMLLRLTESTVRDAAGFDIFCFVTLAGIVYCGIEAWLPASAHADGVLWRWGARLPMLALVFSSAFMLPYLKGVHGTIPSYPMIKFVGKDHDTFCALVTGGMQDERTAPDCAVFELLEQGRDRVLLRKFPEAKIYVVPRSAVSQFVLLPRKEVL